MAVVDELVATLGFQIRGEGNLTKFKRGVDEAERSARRSSGAIGRMGAAASGTVVGVGRLGSSLAAAGAGAGVYKALSTFATYERRMSRIGITAGASSAETAKAGETIQRFANQFAMPVEEAAAGLDTLVSSGMNLKEAMAFLPSVLMTAQASGAQTTDIANTAQKASTALGISASDMGDAFDIMVAGGKAGQFELKDMARYIPNLANRFASLGKKNKGVEGLKSLIALMQTLRERTGTAELAAVQAENLFAKIYSDKTIKNFKEAHIDLRKEMKKAEDAGEDMFETLARLTNKALGGDLSRINELFDDQEMQGAVTTIATATNRLKDFKTEMSGAKVKGSVAEDFKRIASDVESSMQRIKNSGDSLLKAAGAFVAPAAVPMMDEATSDITRSLKADAIRKRRGDSMFSRVTGFGDRAADEALITTERTKENMSYAYQPAPAAAPVPDILRSRRSQRAGTQVSQALASFPDAKIGGADAGSVDAAVAKLRELSGQSAVARMILDVSQFTDPANQAKTTIDNLNTSVTARVDLDISALEAKADRAARILSGLKMSQGVGSTGAATPTPARIGQAGAAP